MSRVLNSELAECNGIAHFNGTPFSGLMFKVVDDSRATHITFHEDALSCQRIQGIESYDDGRPGGGGALEDVELTYIHTPMVAPAGFPEYAEDFDAKLDDGRGFSGAIYVPNAHDGWEARLYTEGNQDVRLWWYPDGRLAHVASYIPVREEYAWHQDGTWKRYCVRASPDIALCMSFTTDHRISLLIMENWIAAVSDPGRRLSFRCIDQFRDILRMRCSNEIMLVVDSDFIDNIPAIIESEFLDDAVTIRWNGAVFGDAVVALFEALSRKKLNTILLESHSEPSKAFATVLAKKLPKLKVISWALNAARRGE
jgi:hypothetical protein